MYSFWQSLGGVFLLELGDKTQLVALSLAARFNVGVVLAGILVATLAVHVLSVALGGCAGHMFPENWINFFAGLAFLGFGLWTLRGDCLDDGECGGRLCRSPFWVVTVTFFVAELGDKTMLGTMALATEGSILLVWLGSSLGMVLSDGLAIVAGRVAGQRLPERAVKLGASLVFFAFGGFKVFQGATTLPTWAWGLAAGSVAAMVVIFLRCSESGDRA